MLRLKLNLPDVDEVDPVIMKSDYGKEAQLLLGLIRVITCSVHCVVCSEHCVVM